MKIKEIMTRDVATIEPEATLKQAAQRMKDLDVGSLPVCDGERLVGMLTDRDITIVGTAEGTDPGQTAVGDVMTPDVVYCYDDQPIEHAAAVMEEKKIRRLVILNRDKRLAGVVSLGDLADKSGDPLLSGQILEKVSEPEGLHPATEKLPDLGESTKIQEKPPEESLLRCSRCGMEQSGWTGNDAEGIVRGAKVYCCAGCADDAECTCVKESERHTGENVGTQRIV